MQVIIPGITLAGILACGVSAVSHYTAETPVASVQVAAGASAPPPPEQFRKPAVAALSPVQVPAYTVRPGDDLWSIAAAHCGAGSDWGKLLTGNKLTSPVVNAGQKIILTC